MSTLAPFKSFRRALGCVLLVLACVFAVGWMRSLFRLEFVEIPIGKSVVGVMSMHGGLDFYSVTSLDEYHSAGTLDWSSIALDLDPQHPPNTTPWGPTFVFDWRRDWAGFHVGAGQYEYPPRRDFDCMIPYWALILPLLVLSGWLLFAKARAKQR